MWHGGLLQQISIPTTQAKRYVLIQSVILMRGFTTYPLISRYSTLTG